MGNDESLTQHLVRVHQYLEGRGLTRRIDDVPPPWERFRADVAEALSRVTVSRPERRKETGEAHEATIRRVRVRVDPDAGAVRQVYERKLIDKVTLKDLQKLENPERHQDLIKAVTAWLAADKKSRPTYPSMPTGDDRKPGPEIRKLRLPITMNTGVEIRDGFAANGDMVRVDVFKDARGFWLVPIYVHQIADKTRHPTPPMKACVANKRPEDWADMSDADFRFSLYSWSYVRLVNKRGQVIQGYYRATNIHTAAINVSPQNDGSSSAMKQGLGVKLLASFEKYRVDLLGNLSLVTEETRLWRGAACI